MLQETLQAIEWALTTEYTDPILRTTSQVTRDNSTALVAKVREYFNTNNIVYSTFSYDDLKPFLI